MIGDCLKRKLVFGDEEQIRAIRAMELDEANSEEEEKLISSGDLKYYDVTVEVEGSTTVRVLASSPFEAKEMARERVEIDDFDLDFHAGYARALDVPAGV